MFTAGLDLVSSGDLLPYVAGDLPLRHYRHLLSSSLVGAVKAATWDVRHGPSRRKFCGFKRL